MVKSKIREIETKNKGTYTYTYTNTNETKQTKGDKVQEEWPGKKKETKKINQPIQRKLKCRTENKTKVEFHLRNKEKKAKQINIQKLHTLRVIQQ